MSNDVTLEKSQEEKFERVIRFLKEIGYFDLIKDDRKFDEFIQNINYDQFKRIVFSFNALLKNKHVHERGDSSAVVMVGGMRGVRPGLRDEIFEEVFNSIKKLSNNQERATLLYYQLLRMHMFSDGNGRTSRFFYELFNKQDDFDSIKKYFIHTDDGQLSSTSYNKQDEAFDSVNGFLNERIINGKLSNSVQEIVNEHIGELPDYMKNVRVVSLELDDDISDKSNPKVVDNIINGCLDADEKRIFLDYLKDSYGDTFSLSGAILTIVNIKKGNIDYIFNSDKKRFTSSRAFVFNTYDPDTFYDWTREDFLLAIQIGDEIKKRNINILNDIFVKNIEFNGISKDTIFIDRKKELVQMMSENNISENNKKKQANM